MIIYDQKPIKILTKSKKDNLYIYNYDRPFKGETTKIIILKKKFLNRQDEDEDYWDFIVGKIVKLVDDWSQLCKYLKKDKFDFCKKVKIYSKTNKSSLKVNLYKKNKIFIFSNQIYQPIDLEKLRKNEKLYKKFENRYCYSMNFYHPDTDDYADYYSANLWFQWFSKNYPEYHLPMEERGRNHLAVGGCYFRDSISDEPKMDYDLFSLFW